MYIDIVFIPSHIVEYGNNGCSGGNYKSAYAYIIKNGGISKQYNYRYKALVQNAHKFFIALFCFEYRKVVVDITLIMLVQP